MAEPASACADLLRWALPRLGYVWSGYRRVYRQVCKRIGRRLRQLHLGDLEAYRRRLESDPDEWRRLDAFCRIPISRFGRDWRVFERLGRDVLPALAAAAAARGEDRLTAWCAGCARGEEAYTLAAVWRFMAAPVQPGMNLSILATDVDEGLLARARAGVFGAGSLRELPGDWRPCLFEREDGAFRVRPDLRAAVCFVCHDVRASPPGAGFDLVLCRNLVLTYFDAETRWQALERLTESLRPEGALVVGLREAPPPGFPGLAPWWAELRIYRRRQPAAATSTGLA